MSQFLRPGGNVTQSGFTGGFAEIDEVVASDSDFAWGGNGGGNTLEVALGDPGGTPGSGTVTIRYRLAKTNAGALSGNGNAVTGTLALLQGSTVIATDTPRSLTGAWQQFTFTPNVAAVTDWNDLRLRFTDSNNGGQTGNRRGGAISWAELEAPDALSAISGSGSGALPIGGSASGTVTASAVVGTAGGSLQLSGLAAATAPIGGGGEGNLLLSGAGSGALPVSGGASAAIGLSGAAAGTAGASGSASGTLGLTGDALAAAAIAGAAAGALGLGGSASGGAETFAATATGSGALVLAGSANAAVEVRAAGAGAIGMGGSAEALVDVRASAAGVFAIAGTTSGDVRVPAAPLAALPQGFRAAVRRLPSRRASVGVRAARAAVRPLGSARALAEAG